MLTRERKAHIQEVLRRDGRVVAKALSQALDLSEDTIRRDLRELASEGLLQRVHGGALPASLAVANFAGRLGLATDAKAAIGRAAARMVRPGQVVFLDGGTTAVQLARHLPPSLIATVVTHSPSVAVELVGHANVTVELIGGRLFKHSVVAVGASAIEGIGRIRADTYFMGVTGIHPEMGFTTGDSEEAAVKRWITRHAAETVVLASREKLGAASPYQVVPLSGVTTLVVESDLPQPLLDPYRAAGIGIVHAPPMG
jgi:DeoR/GlpR family transcriptional regulator of sugar metabolism